MTQEKELFGFGAAFITGSRAYGTPREDSDTDLVVLVSQQEANLLWDTCEGYEGDTARFGKLNLVILSKDRPHDVEQFRLWKQGTDELIARKPVDRETAVEHFKELGIVCDYE